MKKKYCIGFFVALFVFVSLLGIGYQVSYQYVMDRQMARQQDKQQRSVAVKGEAEKNEGYYLAELHGYVVVYLSDQSTIYEFTDIPFEELPKEVQTNVKQKNMLKQRRNFTHFWKIIPAKKQRGRRKSRNSVRWRKNFWERIRLWTNKR